MPPDHPDPLATDDPMVPVRHPVPTSVEKAHAVAVAGLVLVAVLSLTSIARGVGTIDGRGLLTALLAVGVAIAAWVFGNPRARLRRRFARATPGHPHRIHGDTLALPLTPDPAPSPFDPADPTQLDAATTLRRCRLRDGLGLEPGDPDALLLSLRQMHLINAPLDLRVGQWITVARFLEARPDARAAWLAALACAEDDDFDRALSALGALRDLPGEAEARVALDWLAEAGPRPARVAAALHTASVPRIDGLLGDTLGPPDETAALMTARWRLDPDPAQLDRWLADPERARVVAALSLPGVGPAHWTRLAAHPVLDVAADAVRSALSRDAPAALAAARVLLDRDDAREALGHFAGATPLFDAVSRALERLGYAGETDDQPRLGRWTDVPGLGRQAARHRQALEALAGRPENAGGLSMAGVEAGAGGLSIPDARGGALSAADHPDEEAKG